MPFYRRLALIFLGTVLTLVGLVFFITMCGPNSHWVGAVLGAAGGAIIGVRRKVHRVRWFATAGGILLALLALVMQHVSQGSCAGAFNAFGSGAFVGFGIGSVVDGFRGAASAQSDSPVTRATST